MEEPRLNDRLESLDQAANEWATLTRDQLKRKLLSLGVHDRVRVSQVTGRKVTRGTDKPLQQSVGYSIKKSFGVLDYIGVKFARQGIFIERGVGRGRPVGSPAAEASKQVWLSVVLPPRIEVLADMLADSYADVVAAEIRFLIPGLIDTKISR